MGQITRFVAGSNVYTFPTALGDQEYRDNFKEVMTSVSRIPGADGGIDDYGTSRAPGPVGLIQVGIILESATREGMQALRDALATMREWGVGQLYFQPTDPGATPRWAHCRVKNIEIAEKRHEHTDLFQPAKLTFQAAEPFWYTPGNQALWDGTYTFDGSISWGGSGYTSVTGSGALSVTNNGNALTLGRFEAKVTGAQTFNQLIVRRMVESNVIDEMFLQATLVQNDIIEFDPRKQWVLVNGVDRFNDFTFRHPDWLRLLPGANSVQVILDESAAQIDAVVRYFERYV